MDGKNLPRPALAGLFIIIVVQIGGFALLWSKDALPPEYVYLPTTADKTVTDSPVNTPVVVVAPPDEKALREIIQTVLEQELAPYTQRFTTASNTTQKIIPVDPLGVKENSPENVQAFTNISNIVDSALAKGEWTNADSAALIPSISNLSPSQRIYFADKVTRAINNQEFKLENFGPSF